MAGGLTPGHHTDEFYSVTVRKSFLAPFAAVQRQAVVLDQDGLRGQFKNPHKIFHRLRTSSI